MNRATATATAIVIDVLGIGLAAQQGRKPVNWKELSPPFTTCARGSLVLSGAPRPDSGDMP